VPAALLTPGQATETINLNAPGSYLPRLNQLDGDIFNLLNSHAVVAVATN